MSFWFFCGLFLLLKKDRRRYFHQIKVTTIGEENRNEYFEIEEEVKNEKVVEVRYNIENEKNG